MIHAQFPKPVTVSIRFGPNFLWHMLAAARIGYDSEYAPRFSHTISTHDLALLARHSHLISFREEKGGDLSGFFTSLPAWLGIETGPEFERFFDNVTEALLTRSPSPLLNAYPGADWTDPVYAEFAQSARLPEETCRHRDAAREIAGCYLNCIDAYRGDVWETARTAMRTRANEVETFFGERDYIARWEKELAVNFDRAQYEFVLCYANKNGPDYNTLGYGSNLMCFDKPLAECRQFCSHEIGAHLMMRTYLKLASDSTINRRRMYEAYESLTMFFNRRVLECDQLEYVIPQMSDRWHMQFYSEALQHETSPEALIRAAIHARTQC